MVWIQGGMAVLASDTHAPLYILTWSNNALQLTAYSLRYAPASGSS